MKNLQNLDSIKRDFTLMVANSQNLDYNSLNFEKLFEDWERNKDYFYDLFGQELIYKSKEKITFHLDDKTRCSRVDEFLEWLNDSYIWHEVPNADLAALHEFVSINRDSFFINKIEHDYKDTVFYDHDYSGEGKTISISAGTKLVKAFKYYIKDKELLYTIQNKASTIIQEDKIEGKLCLSIHPLDYLTISENTLGWRSCHSLDGDFRGGNLNYMADNATIVAYIESDNLTKLHNIYWNNKKWRMLLFFSKEKNMVFAGRQYPFEIPLVLDQIRNLLLDLDPYKSWSKWCNGLKEIDYFPVETVFAHPNYNLGTVKGLVQLDKIIRENKEKLYYNDLLRSSTYNNPYNMIQITPWGIKDVTDEHIYIGKDVICPKCNNNFITSPEWMICDECADIEMETGNLVPCVYCDRLFRLDDGYIVGDHGDYVCANCAPIYTSICDRCGNRYHNDELTWHEELNETLCNWCEIDIKEKKE